jgi:hypothetical protein
LFDNGLFLLKTQKRGAHLLRALAPERARRKDFE